MANEFYCGLAVGLAILARQYGEPAKAARIMHECGVTLKDLKKAGVDQYDIKPLFQEMILIEEREKRVATKVCSLDSFRCTEELFDHE
jgi:hypothetical protein